MDFDLLGRYPLCCGGFLDGTKNCIIVYPQHTVSRPTLGVIFRFILLRIAKIASQQAIQKLQYPPKVYIIHFKVHVGKIEHTTYS